MDNQDTLRGAKIIASRNKEYWDNWQGGTPRASIPRMLWKRLKIGRITSRDGETIIVPVGDCAWYHDGKKWVEYGN